VVKYYLNYFRIREGRDGMTMRDRQKIIDKIFLGVSLVGALFILAEMILQSFGRSICANAGCQVVANSARFGDISILLVGFLTFSLLTAFTIIGRYFYKPALEKYINFTLIVSLACEGFFTGYQAFRVYVPCIFCLIVFGFLVALGLLRLLSREHEVIVGFVALAAVFSLFYLILPAESMVIIPDHERLVLFYSKECKYCAQVMKDLEESKIPADHVLVTEYAVFLKSMGIEHVPTLYVNNRNEKIFLTGKDEIERYITSQATAVNAANKPNKAALKAHKTTSSAEKGGFASTNDHFGLHDEPLKMMFPPSEEGMCRENENCK
jgi:thioredoxin-related protein